jgi:hypothetical protein
VPPPAPPAAKKLQAKKNLQQERMEKIRVLEMELEKWGKQAHDEAKINEGIVSAQTFEKYQKIEQKLLTLKYQEQ